MVVQGFFCILAVYFGTVYCELGVCTKTQHAVKEHLLHPSQNIGLLPTQGARSVKYYPERDSVDAGCPFNQAETN